MRFVDPLTAPADPFATQPDRIDRLASVIRRSVSWNLPRCASTLNTKGLASPVDLSGLGLFLGREAGIYEGFLGLQFP